MGLCKCPKRKVTNLFCFEHRVNVCEHCLVANHSQCIVKSYLQWLQDSDYNPVCSLCNNPLSSEEYGPCVRLTCYDVFHWSCLNQYAQQLPPQTAPAGYSCPICSTCIFPQSNLVSPVADVLRTFLQQVNWARAGLGLPLIEETSKATTPPPKAHLPQNSTDLRSDASLGYANGLGISPAQGTALGNSTPTVSNINSRPSAQVAPYQATQSSTFGSSFINVDEGTTSRVQEKGLFSNPRKLFDSTKEDEIFGGARRHDHDEDKYKRRPALQWLGRWLSLGAIDGKQKKDPNAVRKRFLVVLLLGIIGFITVVIIFSKLGRQATENDPFLDPLLNPNIKIEKEFDIKAK